MSEHTRFDPTDRLDDPEQLASREDVPAATEAERHDDPDHCGTDHEGSAVAVDHPDPLLIDVPATVRLDERFVPRISGLDPGESISLSVRTDDGTREWASTATFDADGDGIVDLETTAPSAGEYDRIDPMGPIWSLSPVEGPADRRFEADPLGDHELRFIAESSTDSVAATVTVTHGDPAVTRHAVDADDLAGAWFEPAGDGPHPGVLVLHGSDGEPMEMTAALLASHGFAALALRYLDALDLPERPVEVPVEYAERAVEWFGARAAVAADALGVYGASMGGQLALLLGSRDDRIDCVVSDCGAPVVFTVGESAPWTVDGEVHPYVPIRSEPPDTWDGEVDGVPVKRDQWIQLLEAASTDRRRAATIPLEDADASILLLSGSDDAIWPATTFGNMVLARLDALEYDRPADHRVYHEAGHVVGYPYRPTTWRPVAEGLVKGGTPATHARAQAEAWQRVIGFLSTRTDAD